ncbi:ABC transporter ATP-binding protein [Nocardia acidivorans]|uniref:ABC transporter ATP-binding protein n=1 Tax=Nocardia acidivorans TaxID=404580 RepID=UPI000831AA93|nr:ABC transporter ATP-binding protein [Nocardia acidivorans]
MTLRAELRVERERFRLDIALTVEPGEVVALLGPNGAGKSTALRALAGLLPLTGGRISVSDQVWDEPPAVFVPAEHRQVGVVFQDYLLFQHLSALENVAFGLRARGVRRADARTRAAEWLDRVGLTERAHATPRALSGGQAQRVALARALATAPQLLLLDEPLAALDASTRLQVRTDLSHHLRDYSGHTVLVTHDPLDAMVLADRLIILEDGAIIQQGEPTEIARRPRSEYVANLVGLNLFRGTAAGTTVDIDTGGSLTITENATGPVFLAFPPTAVSLHPEKPIGSARNTWPVTVAGMEQHANITRVRLDGAPPGLADITPAAVADLRLQPGMRVWAAVKATEVHAYPA